MEKNDIKFKEYTIMSFSTELSLLELRHQIGALHSGLPRKMSKFKILSNILILLNEYEQLTLDKLIDHVSTEKITTLHNDLYTEIQDIQEKLQIINTQFLSIKSRKKYRSWQNVWISREFGAINYEPFKARIEEIIAQNGHVSMGKHRFHILGHLRTWAQQNGQYETWKNYAKEKLTQVGFDPPSDTISDVHQSQSAVQDEPEAQAQGGEVDYD